MMKFVVHFEVKAEELLELPQMGIQSIQTGEWIDLKLVFVCRIFNYNVLWLLLFNFESISLDAAALVLIEL